MTFIVVAVELAFWGILYYFFSQIALFAAVGYLVGIVVILIKRLQRLKAINDGMAVEVGQLRSCIALRNWETMGYDH